MGTGLRLELRQSQQLVMTPQLQQAIKLLQMSNIELLAFVDGEVERNPLLARADGTGERDAPERVERAETADSRLTAEGDRGLAAETFDTGAENLHDTARADAQPQGTGPGVPAGARGGGAPGAEAPPDLEAWIAGETGLRDHLAAQIGQARAPRALRQLALALVEELDEAGFMRAAPAEVADRLGVTQAEVGEALALLQACEPTGIGARCLAECLALQLAERDRLDPAMRAMLDNLDLLTRTGGPARLRALCGVEQDDFAAMLAELRTLDPAPASRFGAEPAHTVIPDAFLTRTRWGGWHVELNPETLPRVLLDRTYAAELAREGAEARRFLSGCRETATWLVKSLDQRARTILTVATEIARQQEGFFEHGMAGLRPLSLRMVADAVGMHESTVSRVTANKYLATERGVFEFKFFFSNAVGGEDVAAESVRHRLRALIGTEARPEDVHSDDRLVEILRGEGIDIARRTVAKYRKALGLPSSVERRRRLAMPLGG